MRLHQRDNYGSLKIIVVQLLVEINSRSPTKFYITFCIRLLGDQGSSGPPGLRGPAGPAGDSGIPGTVDLMLLL